MASKHMILSRLGDSNVLYLVSEFSEKEDTEALDAFQKMREEQTRSNAEEEERHALKLDALGVAEEDRPKPELDNRTLLLVSSVD